MLRYCGPFVFLGFIPLFFYGIGPGATFATVVLLLIAQIGVEIFSARGEVAPASGSYGFRALVFLYIPLQLILIGWAILATPAMSPAGFAVLVLSVGVTTGVFGMLTAHEAVHSGDPLEEIFGTAMLSGMIYRHFRIAHIHGHHRWAATEKDAATARLGEGFYHFLIRTVIGQFCEALVFERRRCAVRRLSLWRNRILRDAALMALLFVAIVFFAGWRGALFFLLQSAVAITVLELFNYIAHYGLVRGIDANGRPEALRDSHSWNSSNILANRLIFNMGRHSSHHQKPTAPYQSLRHFAPAPELPAGYAGSILLALAPPLWRLVMDTKVRRLRAMPA
ncbi:MAG TPA: alkane 1-monooxygenase [Rhizomicrobium sp.]